MNTQDAIFSVRRQCLLLGVNRSTLYYEPAEISERDQALMNLLDEQYTRTPFYGVRKMRAYLRSLGYPVGKDHVRALLRRMGLTAVYPRRNLSKPHPEHAVYPYLLRDVAIVRANQVWSTDITYIRLRSGFAYLVVVIDWHSRAVLAWRLSNMLDSDFCVVALKETLNTYGSPDIFNTDQGAQFTSSAFIAELTKRGINISMDGRGRCLDNIFVERLWRSVKYENVYLFGYQTILEARSGLSAYFEFYNKERFHQSLGNKTPWQMYSGLEIVQPTGSGAQKIMSHIVKSEEKHSEKVYEAVLQ